MQRNLSKRLAAVVAATASLAVFVPSADAGDQRPGDIRVDIYAASTGPNGNAYFAGELTSPTRKCSVDRRINVKVAGRIYDSGVSSSRGTFGLTTNNLEDAEIVVPPKKVKVGGRTVRCIGFVGPLLLN